MSTTAVRTQLETQIRIAEAAIGRLETAFGTGVRPSWVGTDIGALRYQIKQNKEALDALRDQ